MGTLNHYMLNVYYDLIMFDMLSLLIRISLWLIHCQGCFQDGILKPIFCMLCRFILVQHFYLHQGHCSNSFFVMGSSFGRIFILISQTFNFHRRIGRKFCMQFRVNIFYLTYYHMLIFYLDQIIHRMLMKFNGISFLLIFYQQYVYQDAISNLIFDKIFQYH